MGVYRDGGRAGLRMGSRRPPTATAASSNCPDHQNLRWSDLIHIQRREFRSAVAMMVSVGLCAPELGKTEPSATNRLSSWW